MDEDQRLRAQSDIDEMINSASIRMSSEIRRAMAQGEVEFKDMAERLALDMAKLMLKQVLAGLQTQNIGQQSVGSSSGATSSQLAQALTGLVQQGSRFS